MVNFPELDGPQKIEKYHYFTWRPVVDLQLDRHGPTAFVVVIVHREKVIARCRRSETKQPAQRLLTKKESQQRGSCSRRVTRARDSVFRSLRARHLADKVASGCAQPGAHGNDGIAVRADKHQPHTRRAAADLRAVRAAFCSYGALASSASEAVGEHHIVYSKRRRVGRSEVSHEMKHTTHT